tara:strand:- start:65 stop:550 length:486 start_codon:yes stop_codon:yes gene_type:complete
MDNDLKYVGFWKRVVSGCVDVFLLSLVLIPTLYWAYGMEYFLPEDGIQKGFFEYLDLFDLFMNQIFPFITIIFLWITYQATPGKMIFKATIVDAKTGGKPTLKQWIIRNLGYFVSLLPVGLGIFWVAFDKKKQGFHDKLANTVVVQPKFVEPESVEFETEK